MSIIKKKYDNGETELNKFTYTPFMTSGTAPLVTKRIPTGEKPQPVETDGFSRRADDLSRIARIFTRKEGLQFASNNTQLSTAVDLSYTVQGTIKDKAQAVRDINRGSALLDTLKTIGSTLAQVPLAGTGTHFIKGRLFGKPAGPAVSKSTRLMGSPGAVVVKYGRDNPYGNSPNAYYGLDTLNASDLYYRKEEDGVNADKLNDYIQFYFEVLTPGKDRANTFLHFRAFIDNFNDNYSGNWNPFNYIGRGESFYTYQSFNRSINVNFKSAVATKSELKPVYKKLVYLASTTAPTYSENGIMRGTIVKMNIGDYLSQTPGFLSSVTYNWEPQFPFEVANGKKDVNASQDPQINTDLKVQELPHVLSCSLTFTPIHTFTPQTGLYHYITNPTKGDSQFFPTEAQNEAAREAQRAEELSNKINNNISRGSIDSGF